MPQAVEQSAAEILALLTGVGQGQNQSLEAQFEAIRDALQAALVGGGGGGGALTDPPTPPKRTRRRAPAKPA